MIFKDLYSITTEQLKPASHSDESIKMMMVSLGQKMEILKSGLKECQEPARFTKRMENCNLKKMEKIEEDADAEDLTLDIYIEELRSMEGIGRLEIDEHRETKKYHDLLSQGQLDEIREKNTEVLYYLKKL